MLSPCQEFKLRDFLKYIDRSQDKEEKGGHTVVYIFFFTPAKMSQLVKTGRILDHTRNDCSLLPLSLDKVEKQTWVKSDIKTFLLGCNSFITEARVSTIYSW